MSEPRLFLTSMSGPGEVENITEMVEPILKWLDGIVWVFNDCPLTDPGALYLKTVMGAGRVIHRAWPARHWHSMNETLFTGLIEEGDLVLFNDPMERPREPFVSRIKSELDPLMTESETSVIYYFGKPFLFKYFETLEYRQSPHWTLTGYPGRAVEWSQIEPNEDLVRKNMRPIKRTDPYGWVSHYVRYYVAYPAGSNTVALGLDHFPPGDRNQQFIERETRRLEFRRLMKRRGFPLTVEGAKQFLSLPLDEEMKKYLREEKILSDFWHYINGRTHLLKDSHNPADAAPIGLFLS